MLSLTQGGGYSLFSGAWMEVPKSLKPWSRTKEINDQVSDPLTKEASGLTSHLISTQL